MAYVILQPHSNTNHSDKYLVVDAQDWAAFVNKAKPSVAIAGEFSEYEKAVELQDRLNYDTTKDRLNSHFTKVSTNEE
jgi:hypothetical protein